MARFSDDEWKKIFEELDKHPVANQPYGLPKRRPGSVILSSFNIRALGNDRTRTKSKPRGRTQGSWDFLARYASRCDFLAIQEVKDDLSGLWRLKEALGGKFAVIVSDVTGARPGKDRSQERLAYLYRWDRIERTDLASDITYDRRAVLETVHDNLNDFIEDFKIHDDLMKHYDAELKKFKDGRRSSRPAKPTFVLSNFLSFIRTPHVASFRIKGKNGVDGLDFHAVNAHLLYGNKSRSAEERKMEFDALVDWLRWRTKASKRLYHKNMILFGDMNLEFKKRFTEINDADKAIKAMNQDIGKHYKVNFPFLDVPKKRQPDPEGDGKGRYMTTIRMTQTYDQIGLFGYKGQLPDHDQNDNASRNGVNGYDYGVFAYADLFAKALHNANSYLELAKSSAFASRFEHDVSDHLPIWVRLPVPA